MCRSIRDGWKRCAAETGGVCEQKQAEYQQAYPDGPKIDPTARVESVVRGQAHPDVVHLDDVDELFDAGHRIEHTWDGSRFVGRVSYDFTWLVPERITDPAKQRQWLARNHEEIQAFIEENFDARVAGWGGGQPGIEVHLMLDPNSDQVELPPPVRGLVDTRNGKGSKPIFERFWEYQQRREFEIDDASHAFKKAALDTETVVDKFGQRRTMSDAMLHSRDMSDLTWQVVRDDLRRFTCVNRRAILEAQRLAAQNGKELDWHAVGQAYLLARNGHPSAFDDPTLETAGAELHRAAEDAGPFRLRFADGRIHYVEPHEAFAAA